MTPRTDAGLLKFRPLRAGSTIALVAPASPFPKAEFDAGLIELRRLGFEPVYDERVFERRGFVAGAAESRADELRRAWRRKNVDAILSVRGGYGSVQLLPFLDADEIRASRAVFIGYSDVTSLHVLLNCHAHVASIHGPMVEGRLATGPSAYDPSTFLRGLSAEPLGELAMDGVDVLRSGEVSGPLFGGTLTQLLASMGTPYAFDPPAGYVLFIDEVSERPFRLHRMLTQLRQTGLMAKASALVFGQLPKCDEPGGQITARGVVEELVEDFPGPVLFGLPSGHSTTPLLTLPLGVRTRVVGAERPIMCIDESAAAD